MQNLEQKLLEASSAENRINPDEQRHYLGTFAERVVLAIEHEKADQDQTLTIFPNILNQLASEHAPLWVKISPSLTLNHQMTYMKIAQELSCSATIVDEKIAHSPYGLVVHTDKAVTLASTSLADHLSQEEPQKPNPTKKSFFQKLFGK